MTQVMPFVVGFTLLAGPALAQARVYTNADLGKPLKSSTRLDPAAAAAILAPHAFVDVTPAGRSWGQQIVVIGSPTMGPFGEFEPLPEPRRLDGTLLTQPPWHATSFVGRGWRLGGFGGIGPGVLRGAPPTDRPRRGRNR